MSPLAISLRFLQTQSDERLVELARAGHERAFEALVRRYRGPLLAYCRRVSPRDCSPEDILQQGLFQAWKALSGGAEVRDPQAWLYRIVHNLAISALRASGELPEAMIASPAAPGVEQLVEQRMAAREALAGLAALPELQRQAMMSTALDGQSHEEIAAAMGLSSGSVRGLIYRARSTLRAAAAAVIPAPVIDWALGDASGASTGLAGAGSAGLGALILKGGAIVAIGAVAGTAAIVAEHRPGHHHAKASPLIATPSAASDKAAASRERAAGARGDGTVIAPAAATARQSLQASGRDAPRDGGSLSGGPSNGSGDGSGTQSTGSRGGDGSSSGSSGGSDGGSSGSGSTSGGDPGATTATSGTDGGGSMDGGSSSTTSSSDGGSVTAASGSLSGTSDGGSSGGSSSGDMFSGSDGGSLTTSSGGH